jgi:fructose/tagatose bisphosphate aldolase
MPRIRCTWYFSTGRESHSHDCDTVEQAFERLQRTGMDALAFPVGTSYGVYRWDARDNGQTTLEYFAERMNRLALEGAH